MSNYPIQARAKQYFVARKNEVSASVWLLIKRGWNDGGK